MMNSEHKSLIWPSLIRETASYFYDEPIRKNQTLQPDNCLI